MGRRPQKLFVGVGNVLHRDDGVGVRVAEVLARLPHGDDVEIRDAGTCGLDLAPMLENRRLVVVVDALDAGEEPGTVFRAAPWELAPAVRSAASLHDRHLLDALEELRLLGTEPRGVIVLAVQVEDISPGIGLSPRVEAAVGRVARLAARELGLSENIPLQAGSASAWSQ